MARIIMYGAYNLCFDPTLGKFDSAGPDFFEYMRRNKYPVNRIKVILYRDSTIEGLTPPRVSVPLFASRSLNPNFLRNLRALIKRAKETGMTVQLCLFSYHSVVTGEEPERPPLILDTAAWTGSNCDKLRRFFSLDDAKVVAEQSKLVHDIVTNLRTTNHLENVVFEIANELRTDLCRVDGKFDPKLNRQGNCAMVPWLNRMAEVIRGAAAPARVRITTSTGAHDENIDPVKTGEASEGIFFNKNRGSHNCPGTPAFVPDYFDLHAGQWEPAGINWETDRVRYLQALPGSIYAAGKRIYDYGYPSPEIVINDDGLRDRKRAALLEHYVQAAFMCGFGVATKQEYPPLPFDTGALGILKRLKDVPLGPASPLEP